MRESAIRRAPPSRTEMVNAMPSSEALALPASIAFSTLLVR
jgi:hypothetical protein